MTTATTLAVGASGLAVLLVLLATRVQDARTAERPAATSAPEVRQGSEPAATPQPNGDGTRLALAIGPHAASHPGLSGIHAFPDAGDAFAVRVALAAAAERTLDVQYYIWHGDETGTLLFEALWRAAARGVRVRLLLDDNGTSGLDPTLAALDAHPNIEVRLYNPFRHRRFRFIDFATDFRRVNRRMHNKSFTADRQATIIGGRNVGNEYFGEGEGTVFADLDVIATGAVVRDVVDAFERFWTSPSAYPAGRMLAPAPPDAAKALEARFAQVRATQEAEKYLAAVRQSSTVQDLLGARLALEWTKALLLCDDPAKTLDRTGRKDILLLSSMLEAVGHPAARFDLVSPYFVPGEHGTAALTALAARGVKVSVLTNSLAATDVSAVHAGYSKRRGGLVDGGVRMFELERSAFETRKEGRPWLSASAASLHAKTFAVDRARIFVGSFNFDQRSALLNTEMGLLIDSPALAARLSGVFDRGFPAAAFEVRRAAGGGGLEWIERAPPGERTFTTEPGTTFLQRALVRFLSWLPIEWLL